MSLIQKIGLFVGVAFAVSSAACATETASTETAPEVALDSLDEKDQGTSYNGWTQTISGTWCQDVATGWWGHTLSRTSGDSTRGGGGCLIRNSAQSCSSDSTCTSTAQSLYGSEAYGYCYSGYCYYRPGSQADYCNVNPNRSPGTLNGAITMYPVVTGNLIGCMTKTAGPNFACGGTNTSLYMRTVNYVTVTNCIQ